MSNPSKDQPSKADEKPIPSDPFLVHPKEGKRLGARNQYADPAWRMKYLVPVNTVPRPGFNTTGREVELKLNAYPITQFPTRSVWQYDVSIFPSCLSFQNDACCLYMTNHKASILDFRLTCHSTRLPLATTRSVPWSRRFGTRAFASRIFAR